MHNKRIVIYVLLIFASVITFAIIFSNEYVENSTRQNVFDNIVTIPVNRVGLVLGTSKFTKDNRYNLYFKYRVLAAEKLYKAGKISKILVSGDNSSKGYDEPTDIKNELISLGIPANDIYLDYAGFRTLDSVVRAHEIFGINDMTIISQKFHNQRAIFIAKNRSINAIGYNAQNVVGAGALKTNIREKIARLKTILDIYLLQTKPKFMGQTIEII
jgi:SanA protein